MDEDFALALQLQFEEEAAAAEKPKERFRSRDAINKSTSIVDESWELIDPAPDIHSLFVEFNKKYFWGRLDGVEVKWSSRMTLCAGLCRYEGHGGLCSVHLSQPLLKFRPRKDLVETLLHEMIHAFLFVTHNNKDHSDHGPEFCKHMDRINEDSGAHISIYHSFLDEVDLYRQHWWKCNGPCQKRPPYFGLVRRAMNRAPGPYDSWWSEHQQKCGGTYIKIKEPENFKSSKKEKVDRTNLDKKNNITNNNAESFPAFSGKGYVLGSSSSKKSDNLGNLNVSSSKRKKQSTLVDFVSKAPTLEKCEASVCTEDFSVNPKDSIRRLSETSNDLDMKVVSLNNILKLSKHRSSCASNKKRAKSDSDQGSENFFQRNKINKIETQKSHVTNSMAQCPVCNLKLSSVDINAHVDSCLDLGPEVYWDE